MHYEKKIIVSKSDIDFNGHVGNIRYLEWFLEAASEHSQKLHLGFEDLQSMNSTWVAKDHHISYKSSAFESDQLLLKTWLDSMKSAQGVRKYKLTNITTGKLVCEGETIWVFVDSVSFRPKRLPKEWIEAFNAFQNTRSNVE
jgi:acyl-CoA thioester hydrolase